MIVTVKLSSLNYQTFAIKLNDSYKDSDADFLNHVNNEIRYHIWNNVFDLEDKRNYRNNYDEYLAPPIVMMYSRNKYNHDH